MLEVVADVHERASTVPERLEALGARVVIRSLTCGDYVAGPQTVAERKTIADLHMSIERGRFWPQIHKIRRAGRAPYLILEGDSLYSGTVQPEAVRGLVLAVLDLGIAIIRSESAADTAQWLFRLAERRRDGARRDRPVYAQRPRSPAVRPAEAALAAAPGVGPVVARRLLARYGSLLQIGATPLGDLMTVAGVGSRRAEAIVTLIRGQPDADTPTRDSAKRNLRRAT